MKPLVFCAVAAAGLLGPIDAGASLYRMLAADVRFTDLGTCPASVPRGGKDRTGADVRAVTPSTSACSVSLAGTDFPGRVHNGSAKVRVLTPTAMDNGPTGSLAAITAMLTVDEDQIFASGFE